MKTIKTFLSIFTIGALFTIMSCSSGGDDPDPSTSFGQKLTGTWKLQSVTLDNNDVTNQFTGFAVVFNFQNENQGTFTITEGNDIIFSSGDYSLSGTSAMNLSSGGETINVSLSLSEDEKTLTFSFHNDKTIFGGGRNEGVAGDYVFVLSK